MNRVVSFGDWLRARRRALDLTQDELARRVGCAVITIRKIETDERRPSREMAHRLADVLHLTTDERAGFVKAAREELRVERLAVDTRPQPLAGSRGPPAPTTSLIGRERELDAVRRLLFASKARLVTLTGAGGTGKTRLALEIAREAPDAFPDGMFFVSLAPLAASTLVLPAIAEALGIVEIAGQVLLERVKAQLGEKRALLVLDNFEHVLEAAPVVGDLLQSCPCLKILVTSRAVLHLSGEHTFPVAPFPLLEATDLESWESVTQNEAVRLFAERAQAVDPAFTLTTTTAPIVLEICRRLDGLPLAIELAAARSTMLSPRDILARLESSLEFLAGGPRDVPARQRTMRATIDWSYGLLRGQEQTLFRWLAVFAGSWTLVAAEAICAVEGELTVFELLSSLVDNSLVRWEGESAAEGRFTMLETIREYASQRLEAAGETDLLRRRHAAYFLSLAEEAEAALRGARQLEQLLRLEANHDNLREALRWCLTRSELELSYRFVGALWRFWFLRGHFHEWDRWWRLLASLPEPYESLPLLALRAKVLLGRAFLAHYETDQAEATVRGEECLDLYRRMPDDWGSAASLVIVGAAEEGHGGEAPAASRLETGVAQARDVGDPWLLAWALQLLGDVLGRIRGEHKRATALLEESLELARQTGDCWLTARALVGLVEVLTLQHDYRRAASLAEESIALYRTLGDKLGLAWSLDGLGTAAYFQGEYEAAMKFHAERLGVERRLGNLRGVWHALWSLEMVVLELGDADQVRALNEESLALARELGEDWRVIMSLRDRALSALLRNGGEQAVAVAREAAALAQGVSYGWVRASALRMLAWALFTQGDTERSGDLFRESLELELDTGNKGVLAESLEGVAAVAATRGEMDRAARLFAAASKLRRSINTPQRPCERLLCDPALRAVSSAVGAEVLDAMAAGSEDGQVDAAIADALAAGEGSGTAGYASSPPEARPSRT